VALFRQLGFRGRVLPTIPASGGMRLADLPDPASLAPPSRRSEILIKGYHGWSGRGLNILAAVHMAAPALKRFAIRINLAGPEMAATAETLRDLDGLDVECLHYVESHAEMIGRLVRARMVIGLGISDGISTTLLEAMAVGTFPIQGTGSCGDEWIVPGRTGFLVPYYDVRALADAIRVAASDDALVDAAVPVNRRTIEARWNSERNGDKVIAEISELLADVTALPARRQHGRQHV
jgi:glycosyltransferase involved in cell wall biosynthesis